MADFKNYCETLNLYITSETTSEKYFLNKNLETISKSILENIHQSFELYDNIKNELQINISSDDFVMEILGNCINLVKKKFPDYSIKNSNENYETFNSLNILLNSYCDENKKVLSCSEKLQYIIKKLIRLKKLMYPTSLNLNESLFKKTLDDIKFIVKLVNKKFKQEENKLPFKTKALVLLENTKFDNNQISSKEVIIFLTNILETIIKKNFNIEKNKFIMIEQIEFFLKSLKIRKT